MRGITPLMRRASGGRELFAQRFVELQAALMRLHLAGVPIGRATEALDQEVGSAPGPCRGHSAVAGARHKAPASASDNPAGRHDRAGERIASEAMKVGSTVSPNPATAQDSSVSPLSECIRPGGHGDPALLPVRNTQS